MQTFAKKWRTRDRKGRSCHQQRLANCDACLRPTPADNLPILAGVQPAELRRKRDTLCLTRSAMEPGHLLHAALTMASLTACECGAEEQTVDHVVLQCPIRRPPHGLHSLADLDDETIDWLLNTCVEM